MNKFEHPSYEFFQKRKLSTLSELCSDTVSTHPTPDWIHTFLLFILVSFIVHFQCSLLQTFLFVLIPTLDMFHPSPTQTPLFDFKLYVGLITGPPLLCFLVNGVSVSGSYCCVHIVAPLMPHLYPFVSRLCSLVLLMFLSSHIHPPILVLHTQLIDSCLRLHKLLSLPWSH